MAKDIMTKRDVENENFKITVGTTKKNDPKAFYIELSCFVSIKDNNKYADDLDYQVSNSLKKLSHTISKYFNVKKDTLAGANMSLESIKSGKTSYFTAWIYLMQDTFEAKDFNSVYNIASEIIEKFIPKIEQILSDNNLEYRKNKK